MVVGIACPGLPAANNDAAALCRVATAQDCWSVSVAAGPIIMASRSFGVIELQIRDLGHLGQPGNAGVLDLAVFRADAAYQYGLVGGRVSTRSTDGFRTPVFLVTT